MPRSSHGPIGEEGSRSKQSKEQRDRKKNAQNPSSTGLTKALSETAHEALSNVARDVATFAQRPIEIRQQEAAEAGRVKRPLNAFFLYRKAYQNIAKDHCTGKNHQQVSDICGSSWSRLETDNVITLFRQLAQTEAQLHQEAFPTYKYKPTAATKLNSGIDHDSKARSPSATGSHRRLKRSSQKRADRRTSPVRQSFVSEVPESISDLPTPQSQLSRSPLQKYQASPLLEGDTYSRLLTDAIQHTPHENDPGAGRPPDWSLSTIHTQPYLKTPASNSDILTQPEVPIPYCGQVWGTNYYMLPDSLHVGTAHRATTSLGLGLDVTDAYPAYLQGAYGDWQVGQLENRAQCDLWLAQMGTVEWQKPNVYGEAEPRL
ncbi:HMG box protein [Akanthomyces lecanii RCEF 1005]|uniref:HMG box protein n=1 Tax=Akanthomyces lecanii RCEF 1005 TaxID=1081108 RepID=A0A167XM54_CORDF|nr:HMG box protein [Akanthomyces lecanii RCEF 1005]